MSKREKIIYLSVGIAYVFLFVGLIPTHYQICETNQYAEHEHCTSYQILPFALIKLVKFIDASGPTITALATIAIAAFTWTLKKATDRLWLAGEKQIGITRQSADAATRSAKVAEDAMFVANRPYMFVTKANFNPVLDFEKFDFTGPPIWPSIDYSVENHGNTPATIMFVCADSVCVAQLPKTPEYRDATTYGPNRMVLGRQKSLRLTYVFKTPIDGSVMNDILVGATAGGRNLYAFGFIKFEDVFGYINQIGFCWRYMPRQKGFYPDDTEAYNYHWVSKTPTPEPPVQ